MDISAVRQALADAADTIAGLRCYGYVPDSVVVPCFFPAEVEIETNNSFGGYDIAEFTCRVLVSKADDRSGQMMLDQFLGRTGANSIRAAIMAARNPGVSALNGTADDLKISRVQGYRQYIVGEATYYGAEIIVQVHGKNVGS